MKLASRFLSAVLFPSLVIAPAIAAGPFTVVADGLQNPRGLAFGPGGRLYVAQAGSGGATATGKITEIRYPWLANPAVHDVVTGLISVGKESTTVIGDRVVGEVSKDLLRPVRMHQVKRVGRRIGDIQLVRQRQHPVRVRIRKITRREVVVDYCPGVIEVSDIRDIADLAALAHFKQMPESRGEARGGVRDLYSCIESAVADGREPGNANGRTLFADRDEPGDDIVDCRICQPGIADLRNFARRGGTAGASLSNIQPTSRAERQAAWVLETVCYYCERTASNCWRDHKRRKQNCTQKT